MHDMVNAFCFAAFKAGSNMAARMAMMAITTNNSIKVKPVLRDFILETLSQKFLNFHFELPAQPDQMSDWAGADVNQNSLFYGKSIKRKNRFPLLAG
jgi:hypothetical protein